MTGENEELKYKKKKPSNVSKSKEKSNHKHLYQKCVIYNDRHVTTAEYCTICGKISNKAFLLSEPVEGSNVRRLLTDEEIFEKYSHLPKFKVENIFDIKYIKINEVI